MDQPGYAIIQPEEGDWTDGGPGLQRDALTRRLGCTDTTVDRCRTRGGASATLPADREQLFVPLDGAGALRVDGESHPIGAGSVARVAPALPRSAVNPGERDLTWLMIGAPPTGAADEWEPGAENREWPGPD